MKSILKQILNFICISGVGWIIDFTVFYFLTNRLNLNVGYSNFVSAIPAVTYVFIISTRNIFSKNISKFSIKVKYIIYFIYQLLLVSCVSVIGQYFYELLMSTSLTCNSTITNHLSIFVKLCITPITLCANFLFMKVLIEKI